MTEKKSIAIESFTDNVEDISFELKEGVTLPTETTPPATPAPVAQTPPATTETTTTTPPATETPAATATTETPATTETTVEKKNVLDLLKSEETPASTEQVTPNIEEIKAQTKKELLEELQKSDDPFVKMLTLGVKPEDLPKILQEIVPEDNSKKSIDELVKLDFQNRLGLQGEELTEAIEQRLSELDEMPKWKKAEFEHELRSKFKPSGLGESQILKQYEDAYNNAIKSQSPAITPEQIDGFIKEDIKEISTFANNLVGAEIDGVELTAEDIKTAVIDQYNYDEADIKYFDKKQGKIDVKKFVQDKLLSNPQLIERRIQARVEAEKKKWIAEYTGATPTASGTPSQLSNTTKDVSQSFIEGLDL